MSSPLAIAGVTAVLRDLLNDGLVNNDVSGVVGGNVDISAQPPDRILTNGGLEQPRLNWFLYRVTPNSGYQNACWPSHDDRGQRVSNPPLALDLHYLLSAYGLEDLQAEILLGWAMHLLHEHSVLTREDINQALNPPPEVGAGLPPHLRSLAQTGLADQAERIKITPEYLTTEEVSKLWTAVQSHYRTTAAYMATVVLIQAETPTRTPLPVLTRGPRVERLPDHPGEFREQGIVVQPFLIPPVPTIESLEFPEKNLAIEIGQTLTIHGHHLNDEQVEVQFTHPRLENPVRVQVPANDVTDSTLNVGIHQPADPDAEPVVNWFAGIFRVQVLLRPANAPELETRQSNIVPMMLAPSFTHADPVRDGDTVTVRVTVSPIVQEGQRVLLILGVREAVPQPPVDDQTDLVFVFPDLEPGEYPARVRVDGVESNLIDRNQTPPGFIPSKLITVA